MLMNEMIVSRYSSEGGGSRKSTPVYKDVSDAIQGKINAKDMTEKSPHTISEEMSGKVMGIKETMNKTTSDESLLEANRCHADVTSEEWATIYRYNKIVMVRVFARFKIIQTTFTVGMGLVTLVSRLMGFSSAGIIAVLFASTVTSVALFVAGNAIRRMIGIVYLSPDRKRLKIAHTDFWGRRRDKVHLVKHIVPLRDTPAQPYVRQLFVSEPNFKDKFYFLALKDATFIDPETCCGIFGIDPSAISVTSSNSDTPEEKERELKK
jgi:hypothetical protein